jgi:predicted PurR-regulated permease PerM
MRSLEDVAFLLLVVAVSVAFAWILWPFYGAILWGTLAAIVFAPLHARVLGSLPQRRNLAALICLLIIVTIVILPMTLLGLALLQEAASVYERIQSGELDLARMSRQFRDALPAWAIRQLNRSGLTSVGAVQESISAGLMKSSQYLATQALTMGQGMLNFFISLCVMLYLLFFLLRDGRALVARIEEAIPLRAEQKSALLRKFTIVIRATVKGDMLVALLQGALGGLMFWFLGINAPLLWAVLMAILSLLPAIGAGLVWVPVAIYLLATDDLWQGIVLIAYGALVIGLVDNLLRPILVGKDTKMSEYVVLTSTLGGIAMLGFNGFVVGPVIAAMFIAAWEIFATSRQEARQTPEV